MQRMQDFGKVGEKMLKVGKIEYLNTIPVYYGFITGKIEAKNIEFVEDVPSELNRLLREGFLDISVISSYEFLKNSDKYLLLPNLSISARKKVISVLFLSSVPIHQLHRKDVWLTRSSMTSKELLKFLLKNIYGVEPNYHYYSLKENDLPINPTSILTIGDEALKLLHNKKFKFKYDLAEEWFNIYNLPFVFAVWAVRRDSFKEKPEEVKQFYKKLIQSKNTGIKAYSEICKKFSSTVGISEKTCKEYLENLIFDLDTDEAKSLELFASITKTKFNPEFLPL